jgi:general secretion pathway protein I
LASPATIWEKSASMPWRPDSRRAATRGFTLVEVLVALAILAVALSAALRAANISTDTAVILRQKILASFVASNLLAEAVAKQAFPTAGVSNGKAEQAGQSFVWEQTVEGTASQYFRRTRIKVFAENNPDHMLHELTGFYAKTN